jgi:hypothetical protein
MREKLNWGHCSGGKYVDTRTGQVRSQQFQSLFLRTITVAIWSQLHQNHCFDAFAIPNAVELASCSYFLTRVHRTVIVRGVYGQSATSSLGD